MSDIYDADLLYRLQNSRDLQAHKEAILLLMGRVKALEGKVSFLEDQHGLAHAEDPICKESGPRRNIMDHLSIPEGFKPRRGRPRKVSNE